MKTYMKDNIIQSVIQKPFRKSFLSSYKNAEFSYGYKSGHDTTIRVEKTYQFSGWQKIRNIKRFKNIRLQQVMYITLNVWKFGKGM